MQMNTNTEKKGDLMLTYLLLAKLPNADDGQAVLTFGKDEDRIQCIKDILTEHSDAKLAIAEHWGSWNPEIPIIWLDIKTKELFPKPKHLN